jgi:hypothetical protein
MRSATSTQLNRVFILTIAVVPFAAVAVRFARRSPRTTRPVNPARPEASATVAAVASALGNSSRNTPPPSTLPTATQSSSAAAATALAHATPVVRPPDEAALVELDQVNLMIRDYRTIAGENPVGTNAEIMAALMGDNPKHAKLGPPEGVKLNEKNELIDRWGTPYFFHQLSRDHMEIRSAGPDKVMWTADDPVIK